MQQEHKRVPVWDPFVRVFHWSLVLAGVLAWSSAEEQAWLHERAGYFIFALVGLRVLWGMVGSRHARFSNFLNGPLQTMAYLKDLPSGRPRRYLGHNPAGGWMVIALLCAMLATGASGAFMGVGDPEFWEELHEGLAEFTLLLVVIHLGGVLSTSLLHRENLVSAMWTGAKIRRNADV
mgnify:CR=1 FL=1